MKQVSDQASPALPSFVQLEKDGRYVVSVSVVPQAKRTEVVGLHDGALRVRLHAPPVDGKANDALQRWLADALGVPLRQIELISGASSRSKRLRILAAVDLGLLFKLDQPAA
jgi:uncharacterized protein (TIGR00251 family)